jgi:hypothetical protein
MTVRKVGIIFANNWVKVTKPSRYNSFAWALTREQSVIRGFQVSSDCTVRTGKGKRSWVMGSIVRFPDRRRSVLVHRTHSLDPLSFSESSKNFAIMRMTLGSCER